MFPQKATSKHRVSFVPIFTVTVETQPPPKINPQRTEAAMFAKTKREAVTQRVKKDLNFNSNSLKYTEK